MLATGSNRSLPLPSSREVAADSSPSEGRPTQPWKIAQKWLGAALLSLSARWKLLSQPYDLHHLRLPTNNSAYAISEPQRGGNQYTIGLTGFTARGHTMSALGVGRHALDEVAALARSKENVE